MTLREACFMALSLVALPLAANAAEPVKATYVKGGVFAEGKVWLLDNKGQVSSIAEGRPESVPESLPTPVKDICRRDGHPLVVAVDESGWRVFRHDATWTQLAEGRLEKDETTQALVCTGDAPAILTTQRLIEISADTRSVPLNGKVVADGEAIHATAGNIYLGDDWGEWSGLLQAVDRKSGQVSPAWKSGMSACTALMCDNITGLSAVPWQPDCVAVSTGLMYKGGSGAISIVCPSEAPRPLFSTPNHDDPSGWQEKANGTVAFYGVAAEGDGLLAVSWNTLYHLGKDGSETHEKLPPFTSVGDFQVSFALPKTILVKIYSAEKAYTGDKAFLLIER